MDHSRCHKPFMSQSCSSCIGCTYIRSSKIERYMSWIVQKLIDIQLCGRICVGWNTYMYIYSQYQFFDSHHIFIYPLKHIIHPRLVIFSLLKRQNDSFPWCPLLQNHPHLSHRRFHLQHLQEQRGQSHHLHQEFPNQEVDFPLQSSLGWWRINSRALQISRRLHPRP